MGSLTKVEIIDAQIGLKTEGMGWESARDMCRSIPGGRWAPHDKIWKYPLEFRICQEIRNATNHWESKLQIGPALNEWAKSEKARLAEIPDPNSMEAVEIPRLMESAPKIWGAISSRPFQTVGVDFISKRRQAMLADDPGLGKTLQTIASVVNSYDEGIFLVVAPKSAATITWPKEIKRWSPEDTVIGLGDIASIPAARRDEWLEKNVWSKVESAEGRVWVITGPYWLQVKAAKDRRGEFKRDAKGKLDLDYKMNGLFWWEWDGVIVDESHKVVICNTAKRSKHTQTRYGLDELRLSERGMKIAISGTPMRGKAENMWGTLNWLQPKIYTSYWKWMDKHFVAYASDSPFGSDKVYDGLRDESGFYSDMKDVFIRRTKQEVASDLPPKMYGGEPLFDDDQGPIGVWLDMNKSQLKLYQAMVREGETEDGIIANGILSEWTRLKQFSSAACVMGDDGVVKVLPDSNKLDWIMEFLSDRGITGDKMFSDRQTGPHNGNKVLIASQFSSLIDMFEAQLNEAGIATFKLTGNTPAKERVRIEQEFQNDPDSPKVFLLTTTAGGVSLTLDAADDVIICDETWIPDDQLQVEDRAHRLSRPDHNVTIWYLRSRNSIEEAIAKVTFGRETEIRGIMDKSRGVELRRQIKEAM